MFVLGDFTLSSETLLSPRGVSKRLLGSQTGDDDDDEDLPDGEQEVAGGSGATSLVRPARPKETGGRIMVHAKFSHFFLMLWYVNKIEHVVRNYAKCWVCERKPQDDTDREQTDIQSLCEIFSAQARHTHAPTF